MAPSDAIQTFRIGLYQVSVPTDFGPRVLSVRRGEDQLFARLDPSVSIEVPGLPTYRFYGGHRLWAGPEVPEVTYAPEDDSCTIEAGDEVVTVSAPPDRAGLVKRIEISADGDRLLVDHALTNAGDDPITLAPWAITQLDLGGIALLPLPRSAHEGVQADRSLVLWPYTDLSDTRISWHGELVAVAARPGPRLKLGLEPSPRRLGYLKDGHLFVKELPSPDANQRPDRGAAGQIFLNEDFCELETLGSLVTLAPGESAAHREIWRIEPCSDLAAAKTRLLERR